ncbi:MAG: UDP-N-acetylmuramoyl-tripeptide--D-alanyl-D-alanine ligase [Chloroflexi bacterium]|nr:UDP-N-acetylmuramoyl-tripeptide--D-alanyl-D-alanine ligase [Chloroflexota bacterium]
MLPFDDVLAGVGTHTLPYASAPGLVFSDVTNDSRLVSPGALFVALVAERDGHDFIRDAHRRGARGVLAERPIPLDDWLPLAERPGFAYIVVDSSLKALQRLGAYWRSRHPIRVVGVTGSVGKTTTKEMIATVLAQRFGVLKNDKNMNNEIGLPLTLLKLTGEHQRAVLEMGMYSLGEIALLCQLSNPDIGVVTNVSHSHLERLGTIDGIAQAKSELVKALPTNGVAILNGDESLVREMRSLAAGQVILFGTRAGCHVRARSIVSRGLQGLEFELVHRGRSLDVRTPLLGKHSVYACLAAAAVGFVDGLSLAEIAEGLRKPPSTIRVRAAPGKNGSVVIDDTYNASPLSTIAALDLVSQMPGRRIAVLGDMLELGSYEEQGHRDVGRRAALTVHKLIVVGRRARWIGEEALAMGLGDVESCESNSQVSVELRPGDFVLVKGSRGARMEEIVARLQETPEQESGRNEQGI